MKDIEKRFPLGAALRSYDFPEQPNREANGYFVEGILVGYRWFGGCERYVIRVTRDVCQGKDMTRQHSKRIGEEVMPPVNGTRFAGDPDRVTDGVERVTLAAAMTAATGAA